jgi:serpin B
MKPKTAITTLGITLLLLLTWICFQKQISALALLNNSQPHQESLSMKPSSVSSNLESQLVTANTRFGFHLFSAILKQDSQKNVFVSPTSVAIALSMLYNGASGETQQEMAKALELQGMSLADINSANLALRESLENADAEVKLAIANSLWAREGFAFKDSFLARNRQFYDAQISSLDFANPEAKNVINSWVKEKTVGKIEKIIDNISPADVMFLINAIYFKGNWTDQFDKKLTREQPFFLRDGKAKKYPSMSRQGKYRYWENEQFQAISMPYGKERLSMYIFLPRQESSLTDFLTQLTPENWDKWLAQFSKREGFIQIPRFKLEYEIKLNQALAAVGMGGIFEASQANFAQMTANPVVVDEVKHKTFVEVNEEGTEAAAVTSIGIRATAIMPMEEPFTMIVDRPFFCAIRDNQTGTVLFMGTIFEPN